LRALRGASAVIAVSQAIRERAVQSGVPAARVQVIANAAPETAILSREQARRVLGIDANARVLGWVGRLSREKDPESFVRLAASLAKASRQHVGVMIGDGPLMPAVRASSETLLRENQLYLPGVIKNAGTLLAALDTLVVTSSTEGTPMVILEAMRAGVPVVSTAVGGVPEMLGENCGMLVHYGNDEALFHATAQVLSDEQLAHTLRANASARVAERYDRREWWKQHELLYASLRRAP
jgi:glycosyltransferase involved in cell wall biosynthesis